MNQINEILNSLASMLLMPVMLALIIGFFISGLLLYGLLVTFIKRPQIKNGLKKLKSNEELHDLSHLELRHGLKTILQHFREHPHADSNSFLSEFECMCIKEAELPKILVRVGPMLGLMGTLIPMGPALTALASGDIAVMASNLQIAFATTVIGICVGGCGLICLTFLQRWQAEELVALEIYQSHQTREQA